MFSVIWAMVSRSSRLRICLTITAPINTRGFKVGLPVCFGGLCLLKRLTRSSHGNPGTQYDQQVARVKLVVKGALEPVERKLAGAGIFIAGCTPFEVPLHNPLHLYPLKLRKIILNTDSFSDFILY